MKTYRFLYLAIVVVALAAVLLTGCKSGNKTAPQPDKQLSSQSDTQTQPAKPQSTQSGQASGPAKAVSWKYEPSIKEALVVTSDKQATTIGSLSANQVQLVVPANSFDAGTRLTVQNPKEVPQVMSNQFAPIGAPIDITAGASVRLNQAATLIFRVDKDKYAGDLKSGSIWIAYYNGKSWDYFPPNKVDVSAGMVSFNTYHFSLFGVGKVDVEERIKRYSHSKTLAKNVQENVDEIVNKIVEQTVEHIMKEKLGMDENSTKFKIMASLANDDEYREVVEKFIAGDAEGFNRTVMVFAGKKIAENVEKATFQSSLKYLSGKGAGTLEAASQAAGYLAEGQYKEAGRIMGEKIADGFLVTKFFKAGAEIVQYKIDTWKDAEIEGAYKAFKDGSDNKFFGYNVDAGDFGALWNQMKGIATRLQSEAVAREIKRREDLSIRPPSDGDLDKIRAQVRNDLEKQFRQRLSHEAEMEKEAARLETLIAKFKGSNLLDVGMYGYDDANYSLETRLDQLMHLTSKILRDTGRRDWNTTAFSNDREISAGDMVSLMKAWYSTDGPSEYAKLLKDKFGIDLAKKKYKLAGLTPKVKSITAEKFEDNSQAFQIVPNGLKGQFVGGVSWGLIPNSKGYNGGSFGFNNWWAGIPDGLNPGDRVTISLNLSGDYILMRSDQGPLELAMGVRLNGRPVDELSVTSAEFTPGKGASQNIKSGRVDKNVTVSIPTDLQGDSVDIVIDGFSTTGSGTMTYHYALAALADGAPRK